MAFRNFKPAEWLEAIEAGLDYRRKFGIEGVWGELEAIYYNVHPSMLNDGPNILMSTGDSLLSSLTVPSPRVLVKARIPEAVQKRTYVETVDNLLLYEMGLRAEVDTATLHAYLFGTSFLKIGYDSEFGYDPKLDVGGTLQIGFTLTQLDRKGKRRIEHDSGVAPGMPWVRAVPPHDIIVPWGTTRITNSPWIVHRFVRHIDDLKADRKYKNTQRITPTMSMEDFVDSYKSTIRLTQSTTSQSYDTGRKRGHQYHGSREVAYVELYEIHDRRTGRIMVVTPGHDSFLRDDINALQIDNRLPFCSLSFTPKSRSIWTTPDAYYLHAIQMELSDLAVQRTKMRRLAVMKFIYDKDMINDEELEKMLSPDVGAAAAIEPGGDISKTFLQLNRQIDQGLILEEEHLRRNSREQVGFSRNQMGEFAGGRKTATEAKIVDSSSALRMSRRGNAIADLYRDVFEIVNPIIFRHWTTPRYVEIMGEQNAQTWEQISGPEMESRYAYEVIFTSDQELRQRRIEALQLYQFMSQDPSVDPAALRQYISDQYNDPEFTRLFNADIQNAMRAMRLAGGALPQGGAPQQQSGGMAQSLFQGNGQNGGSGLQGLMAGGGNNPGARS